MQFSWDTDEQMQGCLSSWNIQMHDNKLHLNETMLWKVSPLATMGSRSSHALKTVVPFFPVINSLADYLFSYLFPNSTITFPLLLSLYFYHGTNFVVVFWVGVKSNI